jgi:hypothetical protein
MGGIEASKLLVPVAGIPVIGHTLWPVRFEWEKNLGFVRASRANISRRDASISD